VTTFAISSPRPILASGVWPGICPIDGCTCASWRPCGASATNGSALAPCAVMSAAALTTDGSSLSTRVT
jgi:hypothetical protein